MAASKRFDPLTDVPDLTGKVAIVTGANSGIGFATAQQLANHGAKVYLGARTESKALDALKRIEAQNGAAKGKVVWLPLDLGSVRKAKQAAEEVMAKEERVDILVNNAGQMVSKFELTEDGVSTSFASNHLGHFTFTTALLPLLNKTASQPGSDVRVVNVSSAMHTGAPSTTTFDSIDTFRATLAGKSLFGGAGSPDSISAMLARYGQDKLANILFAKELQRRWDAAGIPAISVSLHPGAVASEGTARSSGPLLAPLLKLVFLPPSQGAATSLFAATSPEVKLRAREFGGTYLVPVGKVGRPSALAEDEGMARRLWEMSEKVVGEGKGTGA